LKKIKQSDVSDANNGAKLIENHINIFSQMATCNNIIKVYSGITIAVFENAW